jgi:adenylate kinase
MINSRSFKLLCPPIQEISVIVTVTGTPGTGKTTVTEKLEEEGFEVIHLTEYFEEKDIGEEVNGEREIRVNEMVEGLEKRVFSEDTVIEGHLAHHFPSDICVVLRCRPDILEERLSGRDYFDRKVEENLEAEKLDIILSEAVQSQDKVIEVDTTDKSLDQTFEEVLEKVDEGKSSYGDIDWTEFL